MNLSVTFPPAASLLAQATQPAVEGAAPAATQVTATVAASTQPAAKAPSIMDFLATPMFPLLLGIIVLYVFMFRAKKKQERKVQEERDQIKRGDEVQTIGGVIGRVMDVRDARIQLKVDENSNTKIWFARNAIHRVLTDDKVEAAK